MIKRLQADSELYQAWWTSPRDGGDRFRELFAETSPAGEFIRKLQARVIRDQRLDPSDPWDIPQIEESVWDQLDDRIKLLNVTEQEHREWLANTKVKI